LRTDLVFISLAQVISLSCGAFSEEPTIPRTSASRASIMTFRNGQNIGLFNNEGHAHLSVTDPLDVLVPLDVISLFCRAVFSVVNADNKNIVQTLVCRECS
jgi:hypothetical protein